MTILDRYIFRNVLFASLGAVGVFAFVLMIGNVVKDLLGGFASGQIDLETFVSLVLLLIPFVVSYALPMGMLTGVLLVLGRMSAQQEITAMRASGWGLPRIAAPIFALALLGLVASVWFNTEIAPWAKTQYRLKLADAVRTNPLSFIVPREFVRTFPGMVIYVGEKTGSKLTDVWVWELDKESRVTRFHRAPEAEIRFDEERAALQMTLRSALIEVRDGRSPERFYEPQAGKENLSTPYLGTVPTSLSLEHLLGRNTFRRKLSLLTYSELRAELAKAEANAEQRPPAEVFKSRVTILYAMQEKFVMAFAILSFVLVGVPLGIKMQRRESSANLGLALVLSMGFYFLLIVIDWLQKQPHLRPDLMLWAPNVIFHALGLWLFWRIDRQ